MCFIVIFSKESFGCTGEEVEGSEAQHYQSNPQPLVGKVIQNRYTGFTSDQVLPEYSHNYAANTQVALCQTHKGDSAGH